MLYFQHFGIQTASYIPEMNILLTFFSSLAEPIRLALMGASLIIVAVFLRKLLAPSHSMLANSAKADVSTK